MSLHKSWLFTLALLISIGIAAPYATAQSITQGDVVGTITDPSGAVVPGATLTLKNIETGATQTRTTTNTGAYRFALLPPGNYNLTVSAQNYQNTSRNVVVAVGQSSTVNVQLPVATAQQTVTVTAEAGVVQTENPNLSTTMSSEQVHLVPNGGGDLSYMAQTAPGSAMNVQSGFGNFSSYGLPAISNNFTYNSMPENDPFLSLNNSGATNIQLGQNDVREATVVSNGYSGEYSMAGANVNYVSKSGSNHYHGNANWYWNGRDVNANNYFNNQSSPAAPRGFVNDNMWQASFGGPIKKDKTFFFVDTEGLRLIVPVATSVNVPSAGFQSAVLANISSKQPGELPFYQKMFSLWNAAPGASTAGNNLDSGGCADFAGGGFGSSSPCALSFHRSVSDLTTEWLLTARLDQNIGNNDKAFLHFRTDQGLQATYTDPINSVFNITSKQPQWEGQLQETHTFGPNTVNSFSLSASYYRAIFVQPQQSQALATMPLQMSFPGQTSTSSGSLWSLGNNFSSPFATPQGRNVTQYGFVDDVSRTMGNHNLKFGANLARYDITDFDPGIGSLPLVTGETMTDFFNGIGTSFQQFFPQRLSQPLALYHLGFYGSDDWHVKPNFKLTLTLRADRNSNPVCRTNCFNRLDTTFANASHDLTMPYNQTVLSGRGLAFPSSYQPWELEPRFGFNWSPGAQSNTVISGGFGIFADNFPAGIVDNLLNNLPGDPAFTLNGFPFVPTVSNSAPNVAASMAGALRSGFASGATWGSLNSTVLGLTNGAVGFVPPNFFNVGSNLHVARFQEWDMQVQQGFGRNMSLSLRYVGNHGIHERIINEGLNAYCGNSVAVTAPTGTASCLSTLGFSSFNGLPALPTDPRFLQMTEVTSGYNSNYNGLSVSLMRRLSAFQFQLNYTWSHALDFVSNSGTIGEPFNLKSNLSVTFPQNPFNPLQNMYGNADYDMRHNVNLNYVYTTPKNKFHGLLGGALSGWTVAGTVFWHTGLPFTVLDVGTGSTLSGFGYGGVTGAGVFETLANQTGGFGSQTCNGKFAAVGGFCPTLGNFTSDVGGFGNQRRNQIYGPKFFSTDLSIIKDFKLPGREGMVLSLGATAFNLFNHPNFDQPVGFVGTSAFGSIVSTVNSPTSIYGAFLGADASPRLLQSQIKLTF